MLSGGRQPAEPPPGQLLEPGHVLTEHLHEVRLDRPRQLRLWRLAGIRIVDESLRQPPQGLRQTVEVAVDRPQAGQADGPVHDPEAAPALRDPGLPFALELL